MFLNAVALYRLSVVFIDNALDLLLFVMIIYHFGMNAIKNATSNL